MKMEPYLEIQDGKLFQHFQIAQDLNTAFTANSVDIVATTFSDISNTNNPSIFPGLRLTAGAGKSIEIANGNADVFGQNFIEPVSAIGIADSDGGGDGSLTVDPSTDEFLRLTRADGGDILIQGLGTFVNSNGIVSSSSGSPAVLLMIEDEEGDGIVETGVSTAADLDQTPSVTIGDDSPTGVTISYTPYNDSSVQVHVNGISVNVGDGVKTSQTYFSHDGINARFIKDITANDQLYWNGNIVGYDLDGSDEIDIIYDASSDDV